MINLAISISYHIISYQNYSLFHLWTDILPEKLSWHCLQYTYNSLLSNLLSQRVTFIWHNWIKVYLWDQCCILHESKNCSVSLTFWVIFFLCTLCYDGNQDSEMGWYVTISTHMLPYQAELDKQPVGLVLGSRSIRLTLTDNM